MHLLSLALPLFSLLSVLSPALALPTSTSNKISRTATSFVTASGTNLVVNGQPFKFVGTNAYWLPFLNSDDDIRNTLAEMSKVGITVVRLWAFNDVTSIPDAGSWLQVIQNGTTQINLGPNGIQRLDKVIQLANQFNIYVYFSLTNNWFPSESDSPSSTPSPSPSPIPRNFLSNNYGGMDAYVREFGVAKTHDEFYTSRKIRDEFQNYIKFIVARYANEPGIIAWELANDARCNSSISASTACNTNVVTQWHADVATFVNSVDPNHLITSGTQGFFCPKCPKLFIHPPPPAPSPAPGTKKRTTGGAMTPSRLARMITDGRRAAPRGPSTPEDIKIRGRWTAPSEAKRQIGTVGVAFDGVFGVDSEDILNAPHIGFGTFQLFPDQDNYGTTVAANKPPSDDFDTMLSQTTNWINLQAESTRSFTKPVVLTAFGLVTADNLQQFVPFNDLSPPATSPQQNQKRQSAGTLGTGVSQQQINNAYSTWLQTGIQSGVGGMVQYQWSSAGLLPASGTFIQSSNPGGTVGQSPNDGYAILGADETTVQQILTLAKQNLA